MFFLPGESHGQRSLEGYSPCGHRVGHDLATNQQQINAASAKYILKGEQLSKEGHSGLDQLPS